MKSYRKSFVNKLSQKYCLVLKKFSISNIFIVGIMLSSQAMSNASYYGTEIWDFTTNENDATKTGFRGTVTNDNITQEHWAISGGYSTSEDVSDNILTIAEGTILKDLIVGPGGPESSVYYLNGGDSKQQSLNNHLIIEKNVTLKDDWSYVFYGGKGATKVNKNSVSILGPITVTGSTFSIYGGFSSDSTGQANENKITLSGGDFSDDLIAGYAKTTYGNVLDISFEEKTTLSGLQILGGYSDIDGGSSTYNTISINNANLTHEYSTVQGGNSRSDVADYNKVTLENITGHGVLGGLGKLGANNNIVNISHSVLDGVIYGGKTYEGSASNNEVNIVDGTIIEVYGGLSDAGEANNNTVNITDSTIKNSIVGGFGYSSFGTEEASSNNKVYLNGNITLSGDSFIVGGSGAHISDPSKITNNNQISLDAIVNSNGNSTRVLDLCASYADGAVSSGNRIIIGKNAVIGDKVKLNLYFIGGSYNPIPASPSSFEFWTKDINTNYIQTGNGDFVNFYFILPKTIQNGDTILYLNTPVNMEFSKIGVATLAGVTLNIGDKVTLIDNTSGTFNATTQTIDMTQLPEDSIKGGSFTTDYTFGLSIDEDSNNALKATVTDKKVNDEIKAPAEGQMASVALLNAGNDLIANTGLENAIESTQNTEGYVASFGAISGGYSKYKTGSHVKMANASILTGFAKKFNNKAMSSVFVEAGYGNYSTHNTFTKSKVKGNGDSQYYGLGLMGRYDFTKSFYGDASIHGGYLNNDWKSNDTKVPVSYGTNSLYYGAHLGLGYKLPLNNSFDLGVYGKYFYAHQEGDDTIIDNTKFNFKDIDSHIIRLGTRLFYNISEKLRPFVGIAWDHEFNTKAKANAGDIAIDAPTLKGDSGMIEFGVKAENIKNTDWDIDASLHGFIGQREGVQGLVKAKYNF